jgi:hypothetical protein
MHVDPGEWWRRDQRGILDAGRMTKAIEHRAIRRDGDGDRGVFRVRRDCHVGEAGGIGRHYGEAGDALGGEAEIGVLQIPERVEEQAGGDQQQRGERDLPDDQRVREPVRDAASTQATRCSLQRALRMRACHQHRGEYRGEQRRDGSDGGEDKDDGPVQCDRF